MEACTGSPMELLLSLKFRGCGKAGAMEITSGFPWLLGKGFAFSTFPHPIFFIKIGHFYFAQNRTFLFWVDSRLVFKAQKSTIKIDIGSDIDYTGL